MHGNAKEQAEIDGEKEIVETSTIQAMGKNKYGNVTQNKLEEKLNSNAGDGKTEVIDDGENFVVKFIESNRYYKVDNDGNVEYFEVIVDENPGNIKIGINGEELKGTEESPFEVWCIEDLVEWSQNYTQYQNSYIKLGRTLNFNSNLSYTDGKALSCNSIEELKELLTNTSKSGFTPIANFNGNFDGQGFEIKNIYVDIIGDAGLFSCLNTMAVVKNLDIDGMIISEDSLAGGITGYSNGTIDNCSNSATIISKATATKSAANGEGSAGGIVGFAKNEINGCSNTGKIVSNINAGGIVGYEYAATLKVLNCNNSGYIVGNKYSAGILGCTCAGTTHIYNCYNVGDISGSTAGGIMGHKYHNTATEIKNCYNFSNISGDTNIGEIIGYNWAFDSISSPTIENVFYRNNNIGAFGGSQNSNGTPTYYADDFDQNFVIKLNDYIKTIQDQEIEWNNWILGNKGYPIFE